MVLPICELSSILLPGRFGPIGRFGPKKIGRFGPNCKPPRPPTLFNHPYRFRLSPFRLSLFLQKCFILLGGKPPRPPTLFNHPYRFRLKSVPLKSILSVSRKVCIFRLWSIEQNKNALIDAFLIDACKLTHKCNHLGQYST